MPLAIAGYEQGWFRSPRSVDYDARITTKIGSIRVVVVVDTQTRTQPGVAGHYLLVVASSTLKRPREQGAQVLWTLNNGTAEPKRSLSLSRVQTSE